jgi:hypothetical protein
VVDRYARLRSHNNQLLVVNTLYIHLKPLLLHSNRLSDVTAYNHAF